MNSSLKLFTQSDILHQIGIDSLQKVLSHFTDSDPQLSCLNTESPYFCSELARLFTQPQSLSPRLCETLVLAEAAALPEHHVRLAALAQQRLPDLCVTEFHPIALAIELWLACPVDLAQFNGSAARAARSENVPPGEPSNEHAAPTELAEGPRDIGSYRHGAPTELFQSVQNVEAPSVTLSSIQQSINPPFHSSPIENQNSKFENEEGRTSLVGRTDSVNGSTSLLNGLTSLVTRYVILPEHAAEALALWIVHTYAFELRDVTTYLALESPVRRCGKSTLLNILSRLVNRPLVAANVSPSALYRAIEELRPTLMIDEADTFLKPNDELIGILNAGYHRATAYVLRVASERSGATQTEGRGLRVEGEGEDGASLPRLLHNERVAGAGQSEGSENSPFTTHRSPLNNGPVRVGPSLVRFSCWCPKIIARIGRLPETLADRCIVIRMQRKTPNDKCERLRNLETIDLRNQCIQFVQDHRDAIISAKPEIPAALNDRAADIWEPLLAIADGAGGDWPARAREAAVALSSDTRENNPVGSLLLDIFLLFAMSGQERIPTRDLILALNTQFADRPWMEGRKGQRSTEIWLSQQLRPFGISPRTFRGQDSIIRGYLREDFAEAFRRYIPAAELDGLRAVAENSQPRMNTDEH